MLPCREIQNGLGNHKYCGRTENFLYNGHFSLQYKEMLRLSQYSWNMGKVMTSSKYQIKHYFTLFD